MGENMTDHTESDRPSNPDAELAQLCSCVPIALGLLDCDLRYVRVNKRLAEINGRSVEDHIGRTVFEVIPDISEKVAPMYRRVIETREPVSNLEITGATPADPDAVRHFLANYDPWQGDDGEIKGVSVVVEDITERKKAEQTIEDQLAFERLVSQISATFNNLPGTAFEQAIQDALTVIGGYFGVDSVKLYRLSLQGDVVKLRITWRAKGLAPPGEMPELLKRNYLGFAEHYAQGESNLFDKLHECQPWPGMRETMEFLGVKAGLGVPLECDDSGVDVFAMDKVQADYVWPENTLQRAEAIGKTLLGAMRRKEAEEQLEDSYEEVKSLKDRLEAENIYLREEIRLEQPHTRIIGQSKLMRKSLQQVEQVAKTDATVLLEGETGTGKELLAEAIHDLSSRSKRTLVKVNCAALPDTLVESELFGREKGAYTGALTKQVGRFELAHQSTLFLDEIGELSPEVQAKLLRVLQEGEFERLGSSRTVKVDVRIITATNRNLEKAVKDGSFREDLFYRLRVFPITVPPLRDRPDDIPQLVWHFVNELQNLMGKRVDHISKMTMTALQQYPWPGNVRELRNVLEHALIVSTGKKLRVQLPKPIDSTANVNRTLEETERQHIISVLEQTGWRVRGSGYAAERLGLKPTTLEFRMKKLGIVRPC
jgi:formate hydrogenlyase transcriptional activator